MTATIGLVLDCADPDRLATFWSEALGYTTVGGAGNYVMLLAADGDAPQAAAASGARTEGDQEPDAPRHRDPRRRSRSHPPRSTRRPTPRGRTRSEHGTDWVIMADPEGNEFCVCDGGCRSLSSQR